MKRADVDTDEIKLAWKTLSDITSATSPSPPLPDCNVRAAPEVDNKPLYMVTYFGAFYGRAEAIKQLLAHSGTDWAEENIDFADWPALKPTAPNNQLPMLSLQIGRAHV